MTCKALAILGRLTFGGHCQSAQEIHLSDAWQAYLNVHSLLT
jgi:hypothetical protein